MTTPPPPPAAPQGYANNDEKTWALIAHFGGALGVFIGCGILGWVAPLIALSSKGKESPTVRAHAVAALNFQLTWAGIVLISSIVLGCLAIITLGLAFLLFPLVTAVPIIFGIIGGIQATNGQLYRYPASLSLVK